VISSMSVAIAWVMFRHCTPAQISVGYDEDQSPHFRDAENPPGHEFRQTGSEGVGGCPRFCAG
jgi:hypothetical protein